MDATFCAGLGIDNTVGESSRVLYQRVATPKAYRWCEQLYVRHYRSGSLVSSRYFYSDEAAGSTELSVEYAAGIASWKRGVACPLNEGVCCEPVGDGVRIFLGCFDPDMEGL